MKKLFLLLALSAFTMLSFAQSQPNNTASPMIVSGDTVINTGTRTATLKSTSKFDVVAIQAVITKVNGTVGGYAILQGSLDGLTYVNVSTDTLKLANVTTNSKIWLVESSPYLYYRESVTGANTMKALNKCYLLGR